MKWRWKRHWKIIIGTVFALLALAAACIKTPNFVAMHRVNVYKKSLIAQGEKLDIAALLPPAVPPEQNGAEIVNKAAALFIPKEGNNDPNLWLQAVLAIAPGKVLIRFEQPSIREMYATNFWPDIMASVESNRPATEILRQVINYPALDFQLDYFSDMKVESSGLSEPMSTNAYCVSRLFNEAIYDLHEGDISSAATNICAILALVNGTQNECLPGTQWERMGMASTAMQVNWELLQSTNTHEPELAMLQKAWERLEYLQPIEKTFLIERARGESTLEKMRRSNQNLGYIFPPPDPIRLSDAADLSHELFNSVSGVWENSDFFGGLKEEADNCWQNTVYIFGRARWRASWTYSDELQMLENYQLILKTIQAIRAQGYFHPAYSNMVSHLQPVTAHIGDDEMLELFQYDFQNFLSHESEGMGLGLLRQTMTAEVTQKMTVTAIALKRYQLKHGAYPPDLNALVPEFVPAVPLDPMDGQPLRYRPNSDGTFTLYSIGYNGKDDGGNPALNTPIEDSNYYWLNPHALDWVWPQPATPEEIQKYYPHPPR